MWVIKQLPVIALLCKNQTVTLVTEAGEREDGSSRLRWGPDTLGDPAPSRHYSFIWPNNHCMVCVYGPACVSASACVLSMQRKWLKQKKEQNNTRAPLSGKRFHYTRCLVQGCLHSWATSQLALVTGDKAKPGDHVQHEGWVSEIIVICELYISSASHMHTYQYQHKRASHRPRRRGWSTKREAPNYRSHKYTHKVPFKSPWVLQLPYD